MRLLLLALSYPDVASDSNLYTDLAGELVQRGVDVRVVAPALNSSPRMAIEGKVPVLRVGSGRLLNVSPVRKGLNNLLLPLRYGNAIRRSLGGWVPAWVVVPTPPITLTPLVRNLKQRWGSSVYLVLRDIFPQNAVDVGLLRRGLLYRLFRSLERQTYRVADVIGCMSPANARYVRDHNPEVSPGKLTQFPNWIATSAVEANEDRASARKEWRVADTDFLCVLGGNLGRPQQVDFILDVAEAMRNDSAVRFIIVGEGTERKRLETAIAHRDLSSIALHPRMPRDRYQSLLTAADVGLITLHEAFTIPNIPSRLLGYWAAGVPVVAATDAATDLAGAYLERHDAGVRVPIGNVQATRQALMALMQDRASARRMGANGRSAVLEWYTAPKAVERLLVHMAAYSRDEAHRVGPNA